MENYGIESLKFRYSQKESGKIYSVRVNFTDEDEDSILITPSFINEVYEYMVISESNKELFYILAKAIQLSKENLIGSVHNGYVKKYRLDADGESFAKRFVRKLMVITQYVPMDIVAEYFNEDSKLENLDIFLNQKDIYELTLLLRDDIDTDTTADENSDFSDDDY